MSETGRLVVFLAIVLSIWTAMHAYLLQRIASLPPVSAYLPRRWLLVAAALLWLSYPLGRALDRRGLDALSYSFELVGALWMGFLFLLVVALLAADLATGFGWLLPRLALKVRAAAVVVALALGLIGIVQGLRPSVVRRYEIALPGLPKDLDGTVLVQLSDLHLGSLLGESWLAGRVAQVEALRPDLLVVTGDVIDGSAAHAEAFAPTLSRLHAPLGVWAVTGNHEFYAGLERSLEVFHDAGLRTLRDGWAEPASGLVLAGVDDLTARRQLGRGGSEAVTHALANCPQGATILLSHTPWQAERAAELGVGLMLSGHTHDGQIWPFGYLVRLTYPHLGGRYQIGGMPLVVSRGTGTWGPRMRLWHPAEIVRITLRATR